MGRARPSAVQPDLLGLDVIQPPVRFDDADVRAATLNGRLARAVSAALQGRDRAAIARDMAAFLGVAISKAMLDAYASEARTDHVISLPRFVALLHATGDRRLLEMLAEPVGMTVIPRRHLAMIELAAVREQEDEIRRKRQALQRAAKASGAMR